MTGEGAGAGAVQYSDPVSTGMATTRGGGDQAAKIMQPLACASSQQRGGMNDAADSRGAIDY